MNSDQSESQASLDLPAPPEPLATSEPATPILPAPSNKNRDSIGDFFMGLFGIPILFSICVFLLQAIWGTLVPDGSLTFLPTFLALPFYIGLMIYLRSKGHRYMMFGMITALVVPFIIFGGCVVILTSVYN